MDNEQSNFDPSAIPTSAAEAEALIQHWESPSAPQDAAEQAPEVETQPPTPEEAQKLQDEFVINYKGKEEKLSRDKMIQFAQQGRHYSESMHDLRVQREAFEADRQKQSAESQKWAEIEGRLNRYQEIEAYIKKDPQWWETLQSSYSQRMSDQGHSASPNPVIEGLTKQVEELKGFVSSVKEREQIQEAVQADEALEGVISTYRDEFSHLDWKSLDDKGLDLEKRILDHAISLGLNKPEHFRVAANDLLRDELLKRAELKAKEETAKVVKKTTKLGLSPISDKPSSNFKKVQNVASKSWDEIGEEALALFQH